MSLSKWQKLSDRITEKVVLMACEPARDDTAAAACVAPEASDRSLIAIG
jgi:hypothetical protein